MSTRTRKTKLRLLMNILQPDIETLAELIRIARYESRRRAKRYLHDRGLPHCTGPQLDAILRTITARDDFDRISGMAERMQDG